MSRVKIRAALQTALNTLGGPVAPVNIDTISANGVVTTSAPHNLKDEVMVTVAGHSINSTNGTFSIDVQGTTQFVLRDKVTRAQFKPVASGVAGVCTVHLTAWDNVHFKPVPGLPYQKVNVMFATPENPTMGGNHHREIGFLQVALMYPIGFGTLEVETRAELIQRTFKRGSVFSKDDINVNILKTPEIMNGMPVDEYYAVPIRIYFQADVFE